VRVKLDENLPRDVRERLEALGWDVHDVHEEQLAGALDAAIQVACETEDRVLITLDMDFADVRRYDPGKSPGVIVLRPHNQSIRSVLVCLEAAVRVLSVRPVRASLWIVEPERLRIRDHPTGA
jgi:predicted nuclease of predicted toxin-antitoxin system